MYYEKLLNVDSDSLIDRPPIHGPPIKITTEMVAKALSKMKKIKLLFLLA